MVWTHGDSSWLASGFVAVIINVSVQRAVVLCQIYVSLQETDSRADRAHVDQLKGLRVDMESSNKACHIQYRTTRIFFWLIQPFPLMDPAAFKIWGSYWNDPLWKPRSFGKTKPTTHMWHDIEFMTLASMQFLNCLGVYTSMWRHIYHLWPLIPWQGQPSCNVTVGSQSQQPDLPGCLSPFPSFVASASRSWAGRSGSLPNSQSWCGTWKQMTGTNVHVSSRRQSCDLWRGVLLRKVWWDFRRTALINIQSVLQVSRLRHSVSLLQASGDPAAIHVGVRAPTCVKISSEKKYGNDWINETKKWKKKKNNESKRVHRGIQASSWQSSAYRKPTYGEDLVQQHSIAPPGKTSIHVWVSSWSES